MYHRSTSKRGCFYTFLSNMVYFLIRISNGNRTTTERVGFSLRSAPPPHRALPMIKTTIMVLLIGALRTFVNGQF